MTKELFLAALIFMPFVNFNIIPGEVVPWYMLALFVLFIAQFNSVILLFPLYIIILLSFFVVAQLHTDVLTQQTVVDIAEILLPLLAIIHLRVKPLQRHNLSCAIEIGVIILFGISLMQFIFPILMNLNKLLMNSPDPAALNETGRGVIGVAPEPAYAGTLYLLLAIWSKELRLKKIYIIMPIISLVLTKSLYAYSLGLGVLFIYIFNITYVIYLLIIFGEL